MIPTVWCSLLFDWYEKRIIRTRPEEDYCWANDRIVIEVSQSLFSIIRQTCTTV